MEEGKSKRQTGGGQGRSGASSSSISELFGERSNTGSSVKAGTGVFQSVSGLLSNSPNMTDRPRSDGWRKLGNDAAETAKNTGNGSANNKKNGGQHFQTQQTDPFFLSSSLYYGGQDICVNTANAQSSEASHSGRNDDSDSDGGHAASRGNWWQGSLYY